MDFWSVAHKIWRYRLLHIVLMIFFLSSCAPHGDWAKRIDWKEFEFNNLPGEEQYPDVGAIILLDEGKMEIVGSKEIKLSVFDRHRIIKVLNVSGQHFANVVIPYSPENSVTKIQARAISPDGKITVLDKKNIFDINLYPNFIFYSDQRAKIFTMPATEDGSVIEYRYQLNIPIQTLGHSWNFQNHVPTLLSRFSLIQALDRNLEYRLYNIRLEPEVTKPPEGYNCTYVWEARNVVALKSEYGMPPLRECISHLAIIPLGIESWQDVAQWYHELAEPQVKADENIKKLVRSLTEDVKNDEEKLRRIYEWVRDQVRYIAVEIGIGGFQPHPAAKILKNKYGDCKDMSTLLCSMAREAGLEAYETLVSTWYNGVPDTSLPSPYQFNHVIAFCPSVGDSGVWLDATEKGCPYGAIPWYDQGLPVLVVGKDGRAEIKTTPKAASDQHRELLEWDVELDTMGAAIIQGKTSFWGAPATELRERLYYTSADMHKLWLETDLANRCAGIKLDSFQIAGLKPVVDPLTISYTFHTATFATQQREKMAFRPSDILAFTLPAYFRSTNRVHPIHFRYGSKMELELTLNLPDDWEVYSLIPPHSLSSRFGTADWSYSMNDRVFKASVNYHINGENVIPEDYKNFQAFLDGIKKWELQEVIFTPAYQPSGIDE